MMTCCVGWGLRPMRLSQVARLVCIVVGDQRGRGESRTNLVMQGIFGRGSGRRSWRSSWRRRKMLDCSGMRGVVVVNMLHGNWIGG
jgi:hypothetical protein